MVPKLRIRSLNNQSLATEGDYVLYWMIANRRPTWNFALQRAVDWALDLRKPLVILEALRTGYRWASDRLHRFVLQGMANHLAHFEDKRVLYYPYVERRRGEGSGLLENLAAHACVVVTDEYPCFFLPRMLKAVAPRLPVCLEAVDSNGLLPLQTTDQVFARAYDFRRFLQRSLPSFMMDWPEEDPLRNRTLRPPPDLPAKIRQQWPAASREELQAKPDFLQKLPIDHEVSGAPFDGGFQAARECLHRFLETRLDRYADGRNHPDDDASSGLSPYLHFGHLAAHEVFARIVEREQWNPDRLGSSKKGAREGWWGLPSSSEAFLDELVTWRELGFNRCFLTDDYDRYESLPEWALATLEEHRKDSREFVYSLAELESAETHDHVWNAAQRQLVREGRLHNYLRMLWGKKVLEWTESPRDALEILIELNNKYAVDGRDPNSYSGILWVFGRYDRAWGPERPIYGKIRYMSSENTLKKLKMNDYLARYAS